MGKVYSQGGGLDLVSDEESALRRDHIITRMHELGYDSQAGCRFTRDGVTDYYKAVRGGVDRHLLGFGVSAYSHGWGWFFRNRTSHHVRDAIRDYIDSLKRGVSPVGWAAPINAGERRAGRICEGARTIIPKALVGQDRITRAVLERLVSTKLMQQTDNGWRLTRLGKLFEEEVVSLFYSAAMRKRLGASKAYWADESWFRPFVDNAGHTEDANSDALQQSWV